MSTSRLARAGKKKRKQRGYNRRSRSEHPGVTIASEKRANGSVAIVLRWIHPGTNRRCKEAVKDRNGVPVTSREAAKDAAIAKSIELASERKEVDEGREATDRDTTWETLKSRHKKHLEARGRSPKTVADYAQSWLFLTRWPGLPSRPFKTRKADLEDFVHFVRLQRNTYTGERLAPATVESVVRHIKAVLNYGRKSLSCIRLDAEVLNDALDTGRRATTEPVAYTSNDLNAILKAAKEADSLVRPERHTFPLLATFMLSGCRKGELERLRWFPTAPGKPESYVDFEGDRLVVWSTKTHRHRHVPFRTRPMLRVLLETLKDGIDVGREPYVFGGERSLAVSDRRPPDEADKVVGGEKRRLGRSLKQPLLSVRRLSGVPYTLKGLRSTLATHLANSRLGVNLYQVAFELGHDYAVLVKHYASHRELPREQADADTVERLLAIEDAVRVWVQERQPVAGRVIKLKAI